MNKILAVIAGFFSLLLATFKLGKQKKEIDHLEADIDQLAKDIKKDYKKRENIEKAKSNIPTRDAFKLYNDTLRKD